MIKIRLISVGKMSKQHFAMAAAEYEKRLGGLCSFETAEIAEYKMPSNPSQAQIDKAKQDEGRRILEHVPSGSVIVPMCIEGKAMSSGQLSAWMGEKAAFGGGSFTFIIGGSWGLSDEVKQRGALLLSMSAMTFAHQLARVMLEEQLYRALNILSGGKYHK